jgi:hypothetical protein
MSVERADDEEGSNPSEPWLDDEHLQERENLERLAGDADLARTLKAQGFSGRDYEVFRDELIRYGVAVLRGWLRTGAIPGKCRQKGIRGVPAQMSRQFDGDTAEELAGESVARALEPFRVQALLGGRWDPGRGAALKTYFVHGRHGCSARCPRGEASRSATNGSRSA